MNDVELIREFRASVGACDELAEARARAVLRAQIAKETGLTDRTRTDRARRPRRLVLLAAAIAVLTVVLGAPALGVAPRLHDLLARVSTSAEPIAPAEVEGLSPEARWLLEHGGEVDWRSFELVGSAGPLAYYEIRKEAGERCYASGELATRPEIGSLSCPASGSTLGYPSARQPILDFSTFVLDGRTNESRLSVLTGIAADGVARVGVVDAAGRIHSTPVANNAYYARGLHHGPLVAIVALNAAGDVVYRRSLPH